MPNNPYDESVVRINYKRQLDDKYPLECKSYKKIMEINHKIDSNVLLFLFYKCACPVNGTYFIIRDKRMIESMMYQSKGTSNLFVTRLECDILQAIISSSRIYYSIRRSARGVSFYTRLDLIVGEHMIAEYRTRHDEIKIKHDVCRLMDSKSQSKFIESLQKFKDHDKTAVVDYEIDFHESEISYHKIKSLLYRLALFSYASMIKPAISLMDNIGVQEVTDDGPDDCNTLVDRISCMSKFIIDLCNKYIDQKYVMPPVALGMHDNLVDALYYDRSLKTVHFKKELQSIIDRYLANNDIKCGSMMTKSSPQA